MRVWFLGGAVRSLVRLVPDLQPKQDRAKTAPVVRLPARTLSLCACLSLFVLGGIGCSPFPSAVDRVVDGKVHRGRFIAYPAYSWYIHGAQFEALGKRAEAEKAYRQALSFDPESPELWTRIAAVRCPDGLTMAEQAFREAAKLDPAYAPLYYERGRCLLSKGQKKAGLSELERAFRLDPENVAYSLAIVHALEAQGKLPEAARWLNALAARFPDLVRVQRARAAFAANHEQPWMQRRAEDALARLTARAIPGSAHRSIPEAAIDQALLASELGEARRLAMATRVTPADIALRALALGRPSLALEQAKRVLATDPSNADAWVAALVARDILGHQDQLSELRIPEEMTTPGRLGAFLFAEFLWRRVGETAARAWLAGIDHEPESQDSLETEVARRLEPILASAQPTEASGAARKPAGAATKASKSSESPPPLPREQQQSASQTTDATSAN